MTDYRAAGVDIGKGNEAVRRLKKHAESTFTDAVLRGIGSFAGAIDASALKTMEAPVLLSTIDGVGTKTLVASALNTWDGIGRDIVNHCANDLVCQGARPLFFLDYVASSALEPDIIEQVIKSMGEACRELGCSLIGGELAEMPQVYREGAHDVVGTMVGVVERERMITGETIEAGDVLIALPSNGLHTNGYSLARNVLDIGEYGEEFLKPHTSYVATVLGLHETVGLKGVAHITGGGIEGNLSRIIPTGLRATIDRSAIAVPTIFTVIRERGGVDEEEMFRTFNMGVGMILVVSKDKTDAILERADGSTVLGEVTVREDIDVAS